MAQDLTRREFVTLTAAAAACAGCPLFALGAGAAADNAGKAAKAPVDVGRPEDLKEGITDRWSADGFFVVRRGDRVFAVSSTCTHKKVKLVVNGVALKCPRHGSAFDAEGRVTKPPARKPLPRYPVRVQNGRVLVDLSKPLASKDLESPTAFIELP